MSAGAANGGTVNPLIRKLEAANRFTGEDRAVLQRLCERSRLVGANQDIIKQGDRPDDVHLVLDGIAIRYKLMPEGKRQIVAVLLPGDFCDLQAAVLGAAILDTAILGAMDHSVATLTPCRIVDVPASAIRNLTRIHPRIARAFWWATLVDEGTLRAWLANIGQRAAVERAAHLFCELLMRLQVIGLADENSYGMPFTQVDLGDLLGMSNIHVNRTLQDLREANLIVLKKRLLTIPNVNRLKAFCAFDPAYLHMKASGTEPVRASAAGRFKRMLA